MTLLFLKLNLEATVTWMEEILYTHLPHVNRKLLKGRKEGSKAKQEKETRLKSIEV